MEINPTEYLKPRIVDVDIVNPQRAKVVLEPTERGFGFTLGNSIRRVLLSSIPGFAITQVKIDGVVHEYSTLDGVQEDVVDVLLNIKKTALKMHNTAEATITLNRDAEGPVTAGDFEVGHDVEIINPSRGTKKLLKKNSSINTRIITLTKNKLRFSAISAPIISSTFSRSLSSIPVLVSIILKLIKSIINPKNSAPNKATLPRASFFSPWDFGNSSINASFRFFSLKTVIQFIGIRTNKSVISVWIIQPLTLCSLKN